MIEKVRDYIGWWLLIPALVFVIAGIPGCIESQNLANQKTIETMAAHCEKQGKTYMIYPNQSPTGTCI